MRIAFHAPMKPADHPVPSGDRRMAQQLIAALSLAGHSVEVTSRSRTYLATPDPRAMRRIEAEAEVEALRIAERWAGTPPDLWFTYHSYHKAPDLLGPVLARRFGLPYCLAEASRAAKRAGAWGAWFAAADRSIEAADVHLCFTARDRAGIAPTIKRDARLVDLPPFIDVRAFPAPPPRSAEGPPVLVAVAMMRPGDKLDSFALLAAALRRIDDGRWRLTIVGDGPVRQEVERLFAPFAHERIRWTGALPAPAVLASLGEADLYAWPGLGEAYGLGYLEAQAMGLPVAALDTAGVASVVRHGVTGLLADDTTAEAYAAVLRRLSGDGATRSAMGYAAADWVRRERTLDRAASILDAAATAACGAPPGV